MLKPAESEKLAKHSKGIAIISAAMIFGVTTFAGMAIAIVGPQQIHLNTSPLTLMGLGSGVVTLVLAFVVPQLVAANSLEKLREKFQKAKAGEGRLLDYERLAGIFVTTNILRFAFIEGGIFANLCLFIVVHSAALLMMAGFGLLVLAACFPFPARFSGWIEDRYSDLTGKFVA